MQNFQYFSQNLSRYSGRFGAKNIENFCARTTIRQPFAELRRRMADSCYAVLTANSYYIKLQSSTMLVEHKFTKRFLGAAHRNVVLVHKVHKAPKNQKSAIFVIFRESSQNYEINQPAGDLFCGIYKVYKVHKVSY